MALAAHTREEEHVGHSFPREPLAGLRPCSRLDLGPPAAKERTFLFFAAPGFWCLLMVVLAS